MASCKKSLMCIDVFGEAEGGEGSHTLMYAFLERMRGIGFTKLVSREDSMAEFGISQDDLDAMDEAEFE